MCAAMGITTIREKISRLEYRFSDPAVKRMIERFIYRSDVEHVIITGKIIEEYPDDKYSPSCLIYGKTEDKRNIHVQTSFPPSVVIITTYEPDPEEWIDYKTRR
jgi:Domain of unknown function (DUF4258)